MSHYKHSNGNHRPEGGSFSDRHGLYRSRHGKILGVCKGVADYFDVSVFLVRLMFVAALLFSGFWPVVGLYLLAALLLQQEPVLDPKDNRESSFYDSYAKNPGRALGALKERFESMERRLRRLEDAATSRERDWDRRLREGR